MFRSPLYYFFNYKIVRVNVILYTFMFFVYLALFHFKPKLFSIDTPKKDLGANFWIVDVMYFCTMIHTHVAIGDIVPVHWFSKLLVTAHILIVFGTTCISLVDDVYDTVEEYAEDAKSHVGDTEEEGYDRVL